MTPTSGAEAGASAPNAKAPRSFGAVEVGGPTSGVFMVAADFNVLEYSQRVIGQDRGGAIERNEIGGDRLAIDAHEADGQARRDFAGDARLEQPDNALFLLAGAQQQDAGLAAAFLC